MTSRIQLPIETPAQQRLRSVLQRRRAQQTRSLLPDIEKQREGNGDVQKQAQGFIDREQGKFIPNFSREELDTIEKSGLRTGREQPKPLSVTREPLGQLVRGAITGTEAIAEAGTAATQVLTQGELVVPGIGGRGTIPITVGDKEKSLERSRASLSEIGQTLRGKRDIRETIGSLAERQEQRPAVEQLVGGAIFDPLNLLPGVGFGPDIVRGLKLLKGASREAVEAAIRNAPRTAEGIRSALTRLGDRMPEVKRILSEEGGFARLGGEATEESFDAAVAKAIEQGQNPSTYRIPGTGPDPAEMKRLKNLAFKRVKALRENVSSLGPKAGNLRLELLKAESQWKELVALERRGIEQAKRDALSTKPAPAAKPAAKEPWQMTKSELGNEGYLGYDTGANKWVFRKTGEPVAVPIDENAYRQFIAQSVDEGKPVPANVLADYPDLAAVAPPRQRVVPSRQGEVAGGVKPPAAQVQPPAAETQAVDSIAKGQPAQASIVDDVAEFSKAADPSGGSRPPRRPTARGTGGEPPAEPDDIFRQVTEQATKGEKIEQTLLRRHEAAITTAENEARIAVDEGSQRLRSLGIGEIRQGRVVPRETDILVLDDLFEALHNPSKVASGEVRVPAGMENEYNRLRQLTDWEESMRIDFDPEMAKVEDYFYRGWIVPKEGIPKAPAGIQRGRLGTTPAFKKPRVNATYREMRDAGFEPLSWNPYEQWRISRLQGVRYRQQMQLIDHLKKLDLAVTDASGVATEGWRTPKVGPAFEGKIFATTDAAGEPVAMYSRRWVVPDELAGRLESMYGVPPDLGNVHVGNRTINLRSAIDAVVFIPKRAKLFGSVFQQVDFLTRSYIGGWSGMVDSLLAGKPIEAVKNLAVIPRTTARVIEANFSPNARLAIRQQLDSTAPIIAGRPGIHLRGIMEAGLSTIDTTLLPSNLDRTARVIAEEAGLLGNRAVRRAMSSIESSMRRGLFEGTYPAAQIETIKNSIAPRIVRLYGKGMSDETLNGMIAQATNKMFSTIPASQTVIQNRALREILRRIFFSIGESEGLLRQAFGTIPITLKGTKPFVGLKRQESLFWAEHWLGAYLGLIALANAVHFASTGEPLPADRWLPVSKDKWGPLPIGYNAKFAAPNIPFRGTDEQQLTLDIVGQMDTAFRILDPISFLSSRESVPVRAFVTQTTERDFFGRPIDRVGPGGIYSRTANLVNDLFTPIGPGQAALQIGLQRGAVPEGLIPSAEARIGTAGQLIQATGLNVRAQPKDGTPAPSRIRSRRAPPTQRAPTPSRLRDKLQRAPTPVRSR